MNLNLLNEIIAALIGLATSVLVPYLNKRFGTSLSVSEVDASANAVVSSVEKRLYPQPPATSATTLPPTIPNEIGK